MVLDEEGKVCVRFFLVVLKEFIDFMKLRWVNLDYRKA